MKQDTEAGPMDLPVMQAISGHQVARMLGVAYENYTPAAETFETVRRAIDEIRA